jgi:hypothetical protein
MAANPKVTLIDIFRSPRLLSFFKGFLSSLQGLENYLFWAELQYFRSQWEETKSKELLRVMAWILYQEFLQPDATFEIPIPFHQRKEVFEKITKDKVSVELFDLIEGDVIFCLQTECVPKFLNSEWYQRFLDIKSTAPEVNDLNRLKNSCIGFDVSEMIQRQLGAFDEATKVEQDYFSKVRFLLHWFKIELEIEVLKQDDSILLFSNLEQIYLLHQHISKELLPDVAISLTYQNAILERHFLDIYRKYITSMPFAKILLETLMTNPKFHQKIIELEKPSITKFHSSSFQDLLFGSPIQYLKLMQICLSKSQDDLSTSSSNAVERTLQLITSLLDLDSSHRSLDRERKLFQLRETLVGYPGNLTKPDRSFIREGPMELIENGKATNYYWFLFNDKLVSSTPLPQATYKFVNFYPLIHTEVASSNPNTITLTNAGPDDLLLRIHSAEEKQQWFNAINGVISTWKEMFRNQRLDKENRLRKITDEMKMNVRCSDIGGMFKSYKNCFSGTDCVYYCIDKVPGCNTREEAFVICNHLLQGFF